ncbi:hypothetical protein AX15_005457 [Amanita polypyramis BW_CC]|nr:hypothetical protein AX15_005457 [Amanita polypyramis BW_CC]
MPFFQGATDITITRSEFNDIGGDYIDHSQNGGRVGGPTGPGRTYYRTHGDKTPYSTGKPKSTSHHKGYLYRTDPGSSSLSDGRGSGTQTYASGTPPRIDSASGQRTFSLPGPLSTGVYAAGMNTQSPTPPHVYTSPFTTGSKYDNKARPHHSDVSAGTSGQRVDVSEFPGALAPASSPGRRELPVPLTNTSRTESLYTNGGMGTGHFMTDLVVQAPASYHAPVSTLHPSATTVYESGVPITPSHPYPGSYTNRASRAPHTSTLGDRRMSAEGNSPGHEAPASPSDPPSITPEELINEVLKDAPLKKSDNFLGF